MLKLKQFLFCFKNCRCLKMVIILTLVHIFSQQFYCFMYQQERERMEKAKYQKNPYKNLNIMIK